LFFFNVYPPEIENMLRMHPDIADCAVFSVPDSHWGETIVAAVVLHSTTIAKLHNHCRGHLAGFKYPKEILSVSDIPRNSAQKIVRRELLALWKNRTQ